jgi:formylglycine-generating enzyme required for sulfatase activity
MKDLLDILTALKNTPAPELLIIAGFILLLLALAGRISTIIELPKSRQMLAGLIGALFLTLGICVFALPLILAAVLSPLATPSPTQLQIVAVAPTPTPPTPVSSASVPPAPTTPVPVTTTQAPSAPTVPTTTPTPAPAASEPPTLAPANTPTLTPIPTIPPTISDKDKMKLLSVPAGNFLMGSIDSDLVASASEKPQHNVFVDAFRIDQTDITNAMYAMCMSAGACPPPGSTASATHSNYFGNPQFGNYPVIWVSWNDANAYCKWAARRLPTSAEWEKAARGTDGGTYPWGDEPPNDTRLNYDNNVGDTTEVGHYLMGASPYGALDMAGNVSQWVGIVYETYKSTPQVPIYEQRGGAWNWDPKWGVPNNYWVRAAARNGALDPINNANNNIGFRCASAP